MTSLDAWLQRISEIHPVGWDLGLERVSQVADRMDLKHPAAQVVLVAGTNGKGSTCEFLSRFAMNAGLKTGKSTSPHLLRYNERIVVNGQPVDDAVIIDAFEQIDSARGDITLTYFEFSALASLLIFRDQGVDLAILEVGLGGRLDAMNLVDPDLCVITSIAMDHESWLGNSREAIAREKAGIMRKDICCLVAEPDPPESIFEVAEATGAIIELIETGENPAYEGSLPYPSFLAAWRAARLLGFDAEPLVAAEIARATELPGRRSWLSGPCPVLLDVAHNPAAAAALAEYLSSLDIRGDIHALYGAYRDKDIESVLQPFLAQVKTWHLTAIPEERGETIDQLVHRSGISSGDLVHTYAKIADALEAIESSVGKEDLLLVFGSFPVVAGVLQRYSS